MRAIHKLAPIAPQQQADPADDGIEVTIIRRLVPEAERNIRVALLDAIVEEARIEEVEADFCRKVGLNV